MKMTVKPEESGFETEGHWCEWFAECVGKFDRFCASARVVGFWMALVILASSVLLLFGHAFKGWERGVAVGELLLAIFMSYLVWCLPERRLKDEWLRYLRARQRGRRQ